LKRRHPDAVLQAEAAEVLVPEPLALAAAAAVLPPVELAAEPFLAAAAGLVPGVLEPSEDAAPVAAEPSLAACQAALPMRWAVVLQEEAVVAVELLMRLPEPCCQM